MTPSDVKAIPEGMHTITSHIVTRDAGRAAQWYKEALDAKEGVRVPVPGGKFMQIELRFGDSTVMIADEFPEAGVLSPPSIGGNPVVLHFSTEDVESLWKRAIEAGAKVLQPLQEQFWGDRYGQIQDPFGYRWGLAQHIRDVPQEEIVRIAATIFGGKETRE
jgi:PhnB protein